MDPTLISFSMGSTRDELKTGIFWDVEDFPIPDDLDPATVIQNIKLALKKGGCPDDVFVWLYLPGGKTFSKHSEKEYRDAGIITISTKEDKNSRLNRMIMDILLWSMDNLFGKYANILVISKDFVDNEATFLDVLCTLEDEYFQVLLVLPDDNTTEAPSFVKSTWHWRFLSQGLPPSNRLVARL